jgi:hypothetical protein
MPTIHELIRDHVTLEVECLDRIYLNGYVPQLQMPGQLVSFLVHHRGKPVPSPALLGQLREAFRRGVETFAEAHGIPLIHFERGQRKEEVAAKYRSRFGSREGVVFIGVAQERAVSFKAIKRMKGTFASFEYSRQTVCVNHYYFYLQDADFGPAFIKIGSYAPFPIKVCLNGHEWVKCQLRRRGVGFESLDNGFLSCEDPVALQATCDGLGPEQIEAFFRKWVERLPFPLTREDRAAGYRHQLSIWQVETSLTQVFTRPVKGREFFEEVIRENLDLGRPDRMQLLFDRKITRATPGRFRTRVIQAGVQPSLHVEYKTSHVKQYFKEDRALRTETTINDPNDFGVNKGLRNLTHLQTVARHINRRLLDVQRVSQNCALSHEAIERVVRPTVTDDGQRAPGLPFGDLRVMALFAALSLFSHLPDGFSNRSLRTPVAQLLGPSASPYTAARMTYDLRRLRLKGLIVRREGTHRYFLTPYGWRVALLFTRINARVLRPAWAALPPYDAIPRPLRQALDRVNREIDRIVDAAQLQTPKKAA